MHASDEHRRQKRHDALIVFFGAILLTIVILIRTRTLTVLSWWTEDLDLFVLPLTTLFLTIVFARLVSKFLNNYFRAAAGHLFTVDRTRYALFTKLSTLLIYVLGAGVIIYLIPSLRSLSYSIFAGAGVLAIIIGFATQKTFGNLVSGVMIAVYQPYRIGDRVSVAGEYGVIEDITLRHTIINTWDNKRVVIPNSKMDEEVIDNYTLEDPRILGWIDIGISYDSDIDLARRIMREEAMAHPDFLDNRAETDLLAGDEPVRVRVVDFTDSAVMLRLYFWAADQPTRFKMGCDLRERIKKRFAKEGVEIPYPYRTIVYKKDLPKNA
ncbi:mechanosensitive ion channel family protein [Candidatus Woesearchaeota archaeon]|nr:MAG: mechanosensitive ion channel family protein [Candidatus Woesearchaeota archaeon]